MREVLIYDLEDKTVEIHPGQCLDIMTFLSRYDAFLCVFYLESSSLLDIVFKMYHILDAAFYIVKGFQHGKKAANFATISCFLHGRCQLFAFSPCETLLVAGAVG